jgi:hypothetical protein
MVATSFNIPSHKVSRPLIYFEVFENLMNDDFKNVCLVDSRLGCCFGGIINHKTHMFPSLKILTIGILRPITHDQPEKSCEDFSWVFFHPRCATVP